jgi:FixJ family two-component response regulator
MELLAPKQRILVVDDERSIRNTLHLLLNHDYDVVVVESCEAALEFLEERGTSVSLVLLDRHFPDAAMQGDQLLKIIRERWPSAIIVMLTVDYQVSAAVRCAKLGAFAYLGKLPSFAETLPAVVTEAMALSRFQRETDDYERELRHRREVTRAMQAGIVGASEPPPAADPHRVRDFETVRKEHYIYAYHAFGRNLFRAARNLSVSYDSYRDKLIEWGVHVPSHRTKAVVPTQRKRVPGKARGRSEPRSRIS